MIKRNYYKIVRVFPDPSSYFYIKNETMSKGRIYWNDIFLNTVNLEYSFDKVNWERLTKSNAYNIYVPGDGYIYLRNTSGTFCTSEYDNVIYPDINISLGGDIRTLFNYTDVESITKIPDYGLYYTFSMQNDAKITDISNLSFRGITEIGDYGLMGLFREHIGTKGVDLRDVTTIGRNGLQLLYYDNINLTEAYAPNISTWDDIIFNGWLNGVASSGVIYKPSTLEIPIYELPSGWTTQDYPNEE